ncbi:MAG TPA: histidine kinase [Vicinamibacterales bacterium]|nr:histidine kinase [Vicinamibacterales bacterium]
MKPAGPSSDSGALNAETSRTPTKAPRSSRADELERARRLLRLDEEERRRLSLALHESVTQSLAALTTNLDLIEQQATALGGRTRGLLATSRSIARQCFQQVRLLTDQLSPPLVAEVGLRLALLCAVASFSERSGITVACDADDCPRLPDDLELALFRVVEDCLDSLDPLLCGTPSVRLIAPVDGGVELHVQPVRVGAAMRWQHHLALQFGTAIDVEIPTIVAEAHGGARPVGVWLIVTVPPGMSQRR